MSQRLHIRPPVSRTAPHGDREPEVDAAGLSGLYRWMERYADGDDRAFSALHTALTPRVRGRLGRMIRDPALVDDLVQQTFLRAHQARGRFDASGDSRDRAVEAWYMAIARNVALDYLRSQYRSDRRHATLLARGETEGMGAPVAAESPEEAGLAREDRDLQRREVRRAIERLPPAQAEVVRLHKLRGLSMAEIAERLQVKPGALRVRAHRAYKALASLLAPGKPERWSLQG